MMNNELKEKTYAAIYNDCQVLLKDEPDMVARMANMASLLHGEMRFWWTGFYRVQGEVLVVGPYQGPLACLRIGYGRGVCGTAWREGHTVVVPDVEQFPGHIACSSLSRSEIVVPIWQGEQVVAVLDIDSRELSAFNEVDARWLERMVKFISC